MNNLKRITLLPNHLKAIQLTEDNLEHVESLCKGSIKGTRLPRSERLIHFWDKIRDTEAELNISDWLVEIAFEKYKVFTNDEFNVLFKIEE